jgi:hypothetical protein
LYLLRDETLVKVTRDHSFVGFLEDSGKLDERAAMAHIKRNEIDKALGFDRTVSLTSDYIDAGESPFLPGDTIMLCSDGLTDLVNNAAMKSVLLSDASLEEKCRTLVDAANVAGGKDNITVVLVYNDAAPVKMRATKPKVVKKKDVPKKAEPVVQQAVPVQQPIMQKAKSNTGLIALLSVLCIAFLAAFLWALFRKKPQAANGSSSSPDVQLEQTPSGAKLQDTLDRFTGDTLVLPNTTFGSAVQLTDMIFIDRDSLFITARNPIRFLADSTYNGPAFALSPNCKYIRFENIVIENFETGIRSEADAVALKNVRFINCTMPVQYGFQFSDDEYVNGTIKSSSLFKTDSLPKR